MTAPTESAISEERAREIAAGLRKPMHTEDLMRQWDEWRRKHKAGFGGSATRDEFESIIGWFDEERAEAAALIDDLRARLAAAEGREKEATRDRNAANGYAAQLANERDDAASLATTATARVAELEGALEPFAQQSKDFDDAAVKMGFAPSFDEYEPVTKFTHGDLRRAARALTGGSNG